MQRSISPSPGLHLPVLAAPSDVIVDTLVSHAGQWFRIAGSNYCRMPTEHSTGCRCAIRILTQTAHRIRKGTLGAFASIREGCIQVRALSAADRPDRLWPVEIKACWSPDCS